MGAIAEEHLATVGHFERATHVFVIDTRLNQLRGRDVAQVESRSISAVGDEGGRQVREVRRDLRSDLVALEGDRRPDECVHAARVGEVLKGSREDPSR